MTQRRLAIVTGSPGAGKTTVCRLAARSDARGVHVVADVFYTFPAHPIAPVLPESHQQNSAAIAAACRTAAAFAERGYEVFLDGIFGPWFLPLIAAELAPAAVAADYVVLSLGLDEAIRRAAARPEPAAEAVVRQMHAAFADLGPFASHVVAVDGRTAAETLAEIRRRRAAGALALDLSRF